MSRRSLRTLFAALALGLALAPASSARADAGPRDRDAGPSLRMLVPQWLVGFWDALTSETGSTDPADSAGATPGTASTPSGAGNGDVGLQADPNG